MTVLDPPVAPAAAGHRLAVLLEWNVADGFPSSPVAVLGWNEDSGEHYVSWLPLTPPTASEWWRERLADIDIEVGAIGDHVAGWEDQVSSAGIDVLEQASPLDLRTAVEGLVDHILMSEC